MTNSKNHHDTWNEPPTKHWGIDISSAKIEGIIVDEAEPDKPLYQIKTPSERYHAYDQLRGYDHIISQVQALLLQLEEVSGFKRPEKIGISTPGIIDPSTGVLKNSNILCLNSYPLRQDLSTALNADVLLANDANCFTLAESTLGAGKNYDVVMGLILDAGIGAGIVTYGHLLEGAHGIAGEWGHNPIRGKKNRCSCGQSRCNEMSFSIPALERFYENLTGIELPFEEIVKRAESEEKAALKTLKRLKEKFTEAIAVPINIVDPHAIIIGGAIGKLDLLYTEEIRREIIQGIFNKELKTYFLKPALGKSATVFGAALLTQQKHNLSIRNHSKS